MEKQKDKREFERVPTNYAANVRCGNGSTKVEIANMSLGGALFHSKKQFALGDMMTMTITGVYSDTAFQESVPGKIVTVYRREDKHSYGFQFATVLQSEQTPSLSAFLTHGSGRKQSFLRDPQYGEKNTRRG